MAFEMSLPHAPRIQALAADGGESLAADERQWELYFAAQAAIQEVRGGSHRGQGCQDAARRPWLLARVLTVWEC